MFFFVFFLLIFLAWLNRSSCLSSCLVFDACPWFSFPSVYNYIPVQSQNPPTQTVCVLAASYYLGQVRNDPSFRTCWATWVWAMSIAATRTPLSSTHPFLRQSIQVVSPKHSSTYSTFPKKSGEEPWNGEQLVHHVLFVDFKSVRLVEIHLFAALCHC